LASRQLKKNPDMEAVVRAGEIRVALYPPTYARDPHTGELSGWTIDVLRALGARLGISGKPIEKRSPPEAVACLVAGDCDVAMLGIEPTRAAEVDFAPPLVELDYTVLTSASVYGHTLAELDRPDMRIAVVSGHASTLALERQLGHAELVYADKLEAAFDLLRQGKVEAFASVREIVLCCSEQWPGSRVLDGRYGSNLIGMAVPKGHADRLAWVSAFVEEVKASGLVQEALDRIGWRGARVAG
jgi:polar amino acid transport system substrate-binding protein